MPCSATSVFLAAAFFLSGAEALGQETIDLSREIPAGDEDYFLLPFEVPEGIVEIEVQHNDQSEENVLD
jgi:hypothetical protein